MKAPAALDVKPPCFYLKSNKKCGGGRRHVSVPVNCLRGPEYSGGERVAKRRDVLISPFLAIGAYALRSAVARAEEKPPAEGGGTDQDKVAVSSPNEVDVPPAEMEEVINSRIYDATVIGEPMALGKDKRKVWEKMMNARIVYLGEAEQVPIRDDKELELEIVKNLSKRCLEAERPISLALEAFPCDLQEQLNRYMDKRFNLLVESGVWCFRVIKLIILL